MARIASPALLFSDDSGFPTQWIAPPEHVERSAVVEFLVGKTPEPDEPPISETLVWCVIAALVAHASTIAVGIGFLTVFSYFTPDRPRIYTASEAGRWAAA